MSVASHVILSRDAAQYLAAIFATSAAIVLLMWIILIPG